MPTHIVLLTGDTEFPFLSKGLRDANPALEVRHANSREALSEALSDCPPASVRLLSFSTNVIVPGALLNGLPGPAYNFHPGPPAYPGSHPKSFAIYDGATRFGATAHEMIALVDAGPIVAVSEFDIPPDVNALDLATLAYQKIAALFFELAATLATSDDPLPHLDRRWGARKYTRADYARMHDFDDGLDPAELALRRRAFSD